MSPSTSHSHPFPPFFASHPALRLDPVPHLVLPPPHSAYCLTHYSHADVDDLRDLAVHPKVVPHLGASGPDDPNLEGIIEWTDAWLRRDTQAFPFQVIRDTNLTTKWTSDETRPPLIGTVAYGRNGFMDLGLSKDERKAREEEEAARPDEEGNWQTNTFALHPDHGGKGLYSAVVRFTLETWFRPAFNPRPGQMMSGWEADNGPSRRLHQRAGFVVVGQRAGTKEGETPTVVGLWNGSGPAVKEDTIWRDLPDFKYDDEK